MSYIVFARKWRPQNFDEVLGQEHVAKTLKNAIATGRIAHAYIFCGPRGVGKTSTARILAKALNCEKGISHNPCNKCSTCKEIFRGTNLDVLEIDGASNRGIDEIRQLRENVKFAPSSARFKIYVIDEVHMLTIEAFNALLKTLEEPPEHVKFIFATTQPHKVLATILSRCQRFDFRKIPILKIIQKLKQIIKAERIKIDENVLVAIAKAADGSLRDAESILDQLISYSRDTISLKDVSSVLGLIEQDLLFEFSKKIIEGDSASLVKLLDASVNRGKDLSKLLDSLIEHFRNLMIARISDSRNLAGIVDLPPEFAQAIAKQSKQLSLYTILDILQALIDVKGLAKRINSLRIPLEVAFVKLTQNLRQSDQQIDLKKEAPKKEAPKEEVPTERPRQPESIIKTIPTVIKSERGSFSISGKKEEIQDAAEATDSKTMVGMDMVNSVWGQCLSIIGKKKMSVATYLADAKPIKCEHNILTVSFPKNLDFHKEFLEHRDKRELIEQTLTRLLNAKIRINFFIDEHQLQRRSEQDTFTKDILKTFKGRMI